MEAEHTTTVIQRYLDALNKGEQPDAIVRDLLARAMRALDKLCGNLLRQKYPRLMKPPLNLSADELLSGVVERLLKALHEVNPKTVRQFFALVNRHIRWELNDLARRLDEREAPMEIPEAMPAPPDSHDAELTATEQRMLAAIDQLPDDEREVFELVRIQGLTHAEVAEILAVTTKTVQRRLQRALLALTKRLGDLFSE